MMNGGIYFVGFPLLWAIILSISVFIWSTWIRQYLSRNGGSLGHGANIGWTIIADASTATDIARERKSFPWFLKLFWVVEVFAWIVPISGVIIVFIFWPGMK